jgi:hypothetical protein
MSPIPAQDNPPPHPVAHQCPVCQFPQTKIQRVLSEGKFGSTNYVCARLECAIGIDVTKLETWVEV